MKLLFGTLILLILCILIVWIAVARPTFPTKGGYDPKISITADALRAHVEFLSVDCLPRDHENIENLNKAANYIEKAFSSSADEVKIQTYSVNDNEYKNVIGIYGPDSEEIYVVGAHYDAFESFPGADDNASGVAGLIELGNLLLSVSLQSRIVLVAYTLEEPPFFRTQFMGSAVHAKSLLNNDTKVKLMISLEMIGYFSDEQHSQEYPNPVLHLFYPNQGNFIAIVDQITANYARAIKQTINTHTNIPAYSINAPSFIPGIDFSDHMNYWNHNIPAVMITDTAFYRNMNYHTPDDTHEKLDYEKMAQVVYGVFSYLKANST